MNYQSLIASIQAAIYNNGAELITGNILQGVLLDMVNALDSAGATYGGTITPASAAPADLDQPTVYLALEAGTYTNYLDSGGNPIVTTGPALITYNGGASLVFSKTDLPSGGTGATIITNDGSEGDSVAIRLTDNQFYKRSFRIDMTAEYSGGTNELRIGSLIVDCLENTSEGRRANGYYYGDTLADILSEVAVYQDDTDPDTFYLILQHDSDLDFVTFAITPLDGEEVDAFITNAGDDHTKIEDATITPVGSGGGDGKIGVISQTQTWSGSGSTRTYVMSNPVTGLIPQANIDLFESAGAVFNETTGYFELNGLTDISYEEMSAIYNFGQLPYAISNYLYQVRYIRTNLPTARITADSLSTFARDSNLEVVAFNPSADFRPAGTGGAYAFYSMQNIKRIIGVLNLSAITSGARFMEYSLLLGDFRFKSLKFSLSLMSPFVTKDSLLYLINNEASTSAITITLEASVYVKCQSGGEWYSDINTALSAHTNVSLASA